MPPVLGGRLGDSSRGLGSEWGDRGGLRLRHGDAAVTGLRQRLGGCAALRYVESNRPLAHMDFRILGPLEALDRGRDLAPAGSKRRALLALLLLHANETLSIDRLVDDLWGEHPPATAARTLQAHVSRLRKALDAGAGNGGGELIVTREHGYELKLDPERLDSHRFERLIAEGRSHIATGRPERAASAFESALSLWRGAPLADLAYEPFAQPEIARLDDVRVAAVEDLNDAKLALGRHGELVGQLEALIDEHPYRERLRAQLMLALYRCERQADALQAYQDARRTLVEELGIEPGARLHDLERAILAQDPALATPAMKTAEVPASRLPLPPNRTLGRDQDQEIVSQLLRRVRFVSLIGPGGVGKTRLALEVARRVEREFRDGGWFVSLAATANAEHVPSAITQTMGVTPLKGETPKLAVERFLAPKEALLVLDNFEHLLPAAPLIGELLAAAPALAVMATSREPLRLQAEHRYDVAPLHVPAEADPAGVAQAAAGALFVERALSHDRRFELTAGNSGAVAEICRHLDGLPLAIELAAARTTMLDPEQLNARLASALEVLGTGPRDAPDRQRTLRATIDWSHRLLDAPEAEAFARFAVFAGGATTEGAQEVTGADIDALQGLVDKQLLLRRHDFGAGPRLSMLETVREYANEQLAADPNAPELRERHCRHYVALAERAEPELFTRGEAVWLPRLDAEVENFRAALDWSLRHGKPTQGLRLAGVLAGFWDIRNRSAEGLDWIEAALNAAGDDAPIGDRARARRAQVDLLVDQGAAYKPNEARPKAVEALALCRETGEPAAVARALLALASLDMAESHPQPRRRALADEALLKAREASDDRLVALALMERAGAVTPGHDTGELEQAATALRKLGSARPLLMLYNNAAYNAIKAGSPDDARPVLAQAVPLAQELRDPSYLALTCGNVGLEALFNDDLDRAEDAFEEGLRLCREHVVMHFAPEGLGGLAAIAARRGDPERAARLLGAATAIGPVGDADVNAELEEHFFAPARAYHGTRLWSGAYTAGAQMSFEEAVTFALSPG
jgi:predicted ATPase/DNA-binding SARP family transcriptional activator